MQGQNVATTFRDIWRRLEASGSESARLDARVLLGFVLGGGAERVLADSAEILSPANAERLESLLQRRLAHEPISRIVGTREFWSLNFKVTGATLVPRPDTETVVEAVLRHMSAKAPRILDLGTGSGCILLALLSERPEASGIGIDASMDALAVADDNAQALGLAQRVRFVQADWTQGAWIRNCAGPFDVIVSNPPYIPRSDLQELDADVRDYDPHTALVGGNDGLEAYRAIVPRLDELLAPHGLCVFEVGIAQAAAVSTLLGAAQFHVVETRRDLGGVERVVVARKEIFEGDKKQLE